MARSLMLSVIVPVYNVEEKYLSECFASILSQTFCDYELIVVDGKKVYDFSHNKVEIKDFLLLDGSNVIGGE